MALGTTLVLLLSNVALLLLATAAFSPSFSTTRPARSSSRLFVSQRQQQQDSAFTAFAESLQDDDDEEEEQDESNKEQEEDSSWQARLEELLDPTTSLADRQVLLSELLSANDEIRDSVQVALRDRKIDPLLTPTGKRLQDGTRAVARQLTTDILPSLAKQAPPSIDVLPKIGSRVLNALGSQAKRTITELQSDLQDPMTRIPSKLTKQTNDLKQELSNVFLETPEGLEGPAYSVVWKNADYEVRDYPKYTVASTNMGKVGEPYHNLDDVTTSGAAFNALAAYLFGANSDGTSMDMTTPVTTTSAGEMRFYLKTDDSNDKEFPQPLQDSSNSQYDTGAVQIVEIPAVRLAVRRFPGFVTEGEVTRQKDTLLNLLLQDGVELDVPHGSVVPHVVFQYNPPYTIPMVRRNEIGIPVATEEANVDLETEWVGEEVEKDGEDDTAADVSPSDVE